MDSTILSNHLTRKCLLHPFQTDGFFFLHPFHRDTTHKRNDTSNVCFINIPRLRRLGGGAERGFKAGEGLDVGPVIPRTTKHCTTIKFASMPTIKSQIEPFNKKGVALTEATTFQGDLEWDSLTVMDFVAAIEDEFDIIITMNMQAEIENIGQLTDAVAKLKAEA